MDNIKITGESQITVIGDSLAAGRGSSDCSFDGNFIVKFDGRKYYAQTGRKCWVSVLKEYLENKYPGCRVINNGCNGINSHHVSKYIKSITYEDDTFVMLMIGTNNRKLPMGMNLLENDLHRVIGNLRERELDILLIGPTPSTPANENRGDRKFHMCDVDEKLKYVAAREKVRYLSLYDHFNDYIQKNNISLEEFLRPQKEIEENYSFPENEEEYTVNDWNRVPDGLHPPDSVHRMIAEYIISELKL